MEEIYIISKVTKEIIIDILKCNTNNFINNLNFDEDIVSLIEHIPNELETSYELCLKGNIVSSMILLRSTFENILFLMNIVFDPDIIDEYKKVKNNIKPIKLKSEIIENWDKYFTTIMESKEQTEVEIKNIYDLLSKFVHPNCIRSTTSMIEKDKNKSEIIKYLYMQNITSVLLLYFDFISKYLNTEANLIYSIFLYEIICLLVFIQINIDKIKELEQYNDYMYLHINEKDIQGYTNIISKEINQISEINNNEWKKIINNLKEELNKSKYKQKIKELDKITLKLIGLYNKTNN